MSTVDQKTVKWMEDQGYLVGKVECRNGKVSRDLFGFGDFIGVKPGKTLLVQATNAGNFANRVKKIEASDKLVRVLEGWEVVALGFKPDQEQPHRCKRWPKREPW